MVQSTTPMIPKAGQKRDKMKEVAFEWQLRQKNLCCSQVCTRHALTTRPDHQTSWHNKHQTTYLITFTMKLQDLMMITCWEFGGDKYLVVTKSSDIEWQVYQACRLYIVESDASSVPQHALEPSMIWRIWWHNNMLMTWHDKWWYIVG